MREIIHLNHDWTYIEDFREEFLEKPIIGGISVNIPHTNIELPFNYFDERKYCFISTYCFGSKQ